ncbi:MAG TPA: molybdopterin cofactor-binding domain-containing protein, partial [Rubrivivax sp.]|nr:molybdopterin cofactor-binding domain-containing protein [Rubrivivax sp.]
MKLPAPTRRHFLKLGMAGLSVALVPTLAGCALPVIPKRPQPEALEGVGAFGWVRHVDGRTTLFLPRVEMGQNILTALKQIVCVELGVAWDTVNTRLHSSADIRRVRATVGSESIRDFALPLALACAAIRDALASGQTQGQVKVTVRPLAELRSLRTGSTAQPGHRVPLLEQGQAIVRGEPLFAADVRRPGMLFGRVLRAPVSAALASSVSLLDEAAARAVPGFVALVRDALLTVDGSVGVGIVGRTPGTLDRIEQALRLHWRVDAGFEQDTIDAAIDIDRHLSSGRRLAHKVHAERIQEEDAAWDVDLRIDVPLAAHAAIEPRAAVAEFGADRTGLQLWVGSQDVFYQRDVMVKRLGLAEEQVVVHGM